MKNLSKWYKDWEAGENKSKEKEDSLRIIETFKDFLTDYKIDEKSKSTQNRYYGHLHALGGYLIEESIDDDGDIIELLLNSIDAYEGPLIYMSNESWQRELDAVCKKLYKFMIKKGNTNN